MKLKKKKLSKEEMKQLDREGAMYRLGYKDGFSDGKRQVWTEVNEYLSKMGVKS